VCDSSAKKTKEKTDEQHFPDGKYVYKAIYR